MAWNEDPSWRVVHRPHRGWTVGGGGGGGGGMPFQSTMQGMRMQQDLERERLRSQEGLAGQSNQLQRDMANQQDARQREANQLNFRASVLPHNQRQSRFNTVWGALGGQMGNMLGGSSSYTGRGQVGQQPRIDARPVYSQGQIQQQVNARTAANDAGTASRVQQMQNSMAGRGFGSNSPLAMALQGNMMNANVAANLANERETRLGSAQANTDAVFRGQQAQEQQFASRQREDIERNRNMVSLIGSLGSLIG
jgi:hypothetical protein